MRQAVIRANSALKTVPASRISVLASWIWVLKLCGLVRQTKQEMQYADVLNGTSFPRMVRVACPRQKTKRRRLTATPVLLRVVRVGGQGLCSGLDYDYYTTTSIRQSDGCTVFARDALQLFDDISILCLCFCNILPL